MTTGLPLAGKAALVTGGAGGIGSACARALAQDGAAVTLMGRTPATLEATVAELRSTLGDDAELSWFAGDAMVAEDVQERFARRQSHSGGCTSAWPPSAVAPSLRSWSSTRTSSWKSSVGTSWAPFSPSNTSYPSWSRAAAERSYASPPMRPRCPGRSWPATAREKPVSTDGASGGGRVRPSCHPGQCRPPGADQDGQQ